MTTARQRRGLMNRCTACGDKLTFYTRGDAERFIRHSAEHHRDFDPAGLAAYACPRGEGFHIGHSHDGQPFVALVPR